tara:strand:+ start:199 stop:1953 length:1755 start_codon:yes stop_codon:yes gene_type:complete
MSNSRATRVSLSQSLTKAISELPHGTLIALKKNRNNLAGPTENIKEDACKKYLKEYTDYYNRKRNDVIHPVTNRSLTRQDRIDFIAHQCHAAFKLSVSGSKSNSKSKSSSSSSSSKDADPYKDLKTLTLKDIDKILEYPTETATVRKKHLLSLFSKTVKVDKATSILNTYLEDPSITDENVLLYRKIKNCIKTKYLVGYDPFLKATEFNKIVRDNYYSGMVWNNDTRNMINANEPAALNTGKVFTDADNLFNEAILYSDRNKNENDYKTLVKDSYYKYYSVEFMLRQLIEEYQGRNERRVQSAEMYLSLIDRLIDGTLLISDPDASISFDKSLSWSASPEDPILKAEYKTNKEKELARITDAGNEYAGSINDADFYTMDEWTDMSLRKLKSVVVIPYEENGKTYANAYYVKSLYKAWYLAIKDQNPFLNPSNRKPFTQEDENTILKVIQDLYPGLKAPRYGSQGGRQDICVSYTQTRTHKNIQISYIYPSYKSYSGYAYYALIKIMYPISFDRIDDYYPDDDSVLPLQYNPTYLFEMINTLMSKNKIIGKTVPFKINDIFQENNNKTLNKAEYIRFFDKVERIA